VTKGNVSESLRSANLTDNELRLFACQCCERLLNVFDQPMMHELLEMGRRRVRGSVSESDIDAVRKKSVALYDSLYPGYGEPSADVLALSAAGEVAFTENPLTAALNASGFAVQAVAEHSVSTLDEGDDGGKMMKKILNQEHDAQNRLLSDMIRQSKAPKPKSK